MKRWYLYSIIAIFITAALYGGFEILRPSREVVLGRISRGILDRGEDISQKTLAERIREARERSQNVKGLYMAAAVANDQGQAAIFLREKILRLTDETELNGVVIDVKETEGREITENLYPLIQRLKAKEIWTIARIATFRDNSQIAAHPDYYLKRTDGKIWRDRKGNAWMDPASPGARDYMMGFSKEVADLGFDELQFDYIRFPSDGDTANIVYPFYQASTTPKHKALADFFSFLHQGLKEHKPEIILSADLFGYAAIKREDLGIGQRLEDIGNYFDYISLMLYPSHFYSGFYVPADPVRNLAAISMPYRAKNISVTASANPYEVVFRSLNAASDILAGKFVGASTSSTAATTSPKKISDAKLRPWLQDFDLSSDSSLGIFYDAKAVRAQIDAAEKAGASGWLLWSPTNTYTERALKK